MQKLILFCLAIPLLVANAKPAVVVRPQDVRIETFSIKHDPSMTAGKTWRILCDLDGDCIDDMFLFDAQNTWMVYLHKGDQWHYIGDTVFAPDCFNIESTEDGVNIWSCQRVGGGEYYIGYYRIAQGKLENLPRRMLVAMHDGEDSIASKIYTTIFSDITSTPICSRKK